MGMVSIPTFGKIYNRMPVVVIAEAYTGNVKQINEIPKRIVVAHIVRALI